MEDLVRIKMTKQCSEKPVSAPTIFFFHLVKKRKWKIASQSTIEMVKLN